MELTASRTFKLEPFGKFHFKWNKPKKGELKPHQIWIGELHLYNEDSFPLTQEQEDDIVKLMVKNKTDVLTDGYNYYTRTNSGLTRINHNKFGLYFEDRFFKEIVDAVERF